MKKANTCYYIIQLDKNVFATCGEGDPARTKVRAYAQRFSKPKTAKKRLTEIQQQIKPYRTFPEAKVITS